MLWNSEPLLYLDLIAVLLLASTCTMGMIFLAALRSRANPKIRLLFVAVPFVGLAAVRAFDPIVYFLLQGLIVWLGWQLWHWSAHLARQRGVSDTAPYCSRRFSLATFLTSVLMAALFLLVVLALRDRPPGAWRNLILAGGTAGVATLFAIWGAYSPGRRWWRVITALVAAALLAVPLVTYDKFLVYFPDFAEAWDASSSQYYDQPGQRWFPVLIGLVALLMMWMLAASAAGMPVLRVKRQSSAPAARTSSLRTLGMIVFWGVSILAVLPSVAGWLALIRGLKMPAAKVAQPNGYDELVSAGKQLIWTPVLDDPDSATASQLAAELAKNEEALKRVRVAMTKPCEKHLVGNWEVDGDMDAADNFRAMARALAAEGRLAELGGRIDAAAQSYLDILRLSHAIDRGGLRVDWLIARAVEAIGAYRLAALCPQVPHDQAMKIAEVLRLLELRREPFHEVDLRARAWEDRVYGWPYRLNYALQRAVGRGDNQGFMTPGQRCQAIARLIYLELALNAYRHERGELPDQLTDLIDGKHDMMSLDPFSAGGRRTYVYERRGDSYLLYSVGPDGGDDRGALPSDPVMDDGDLSLEFFTKPVTW